MSLNSTREHEPLLELRKNQQDSLFSLSSRFCKMDHLEGRLFHRKLEAKPPRCEAMVLHGVLQSKGTYTDADAAYLANM